MDWILEVGCEKKFVESRGALAAEMESLRSQSCWVARLVQRTGEMKGWQAGLYKLLGLTTEVDGNSVLVRANGGLAAVSLLDEDYKETIVLEPDPVEEPDKEIRFDLGRGETEIRPRKQCISVEGALAVLLHFFEHGSGPSDFQYERKNAGSSKPSSRRSS